ncbi:MAG TPA: GNAT family N-acetyltransferase [Streptosporangiaceae bacterium]|nr:GNAT family N-acetyltransferase [Streptosporangiaceae bacterium]
MDRDAVLTAYNVQVRQSTSPDGTGATIEADGIVVRRIAPAGQDGSGIVWSNLDETSADAVIAEQVRFFGGRGVKFEWKVFDYDQPADLAGRLVAAGFVAGEPESFVVGEVDQIIGALRSAELPAGVIARHVTDEAGVELMTAVQERVFNEDRSELGESIRAQLAAAPEVIGVVLAMAGDEPVCAGRIEFLPGTEFAGLWGGGTLPGWRKRGIYRALVRYRAELAAGRGYKYLTVDASEDSRPILEKVGFTRLAITTPYVWAPAPGRRTSVGIRTALSG